ncbi:uncharacterized protein LOC129757973 [Uranotaenia lowii]|uniref:uncharacterized protein LOC129757973 n=1 Tax=Uranotaenia lowii TaxID=190385 RepID=UPI00247B0134|nr:uncharacterized protein LOC129757973 [Uranotaenia lowii]XP_055611367.1 uncharacterized protein LOC129757973 [Uranotaenia lowii]
MNLYNLSTFGVEKTREELSKEFPPWFVNFQDPWELYRAQPSYIWCQVAFFIGTILCLVHAFKRGGRWPYLFLGALLHGLVVELITYFVPSIDNFWHSKTPIDFFGHRLPLYIICLYPVFYYQAHWAVSKLHLKCRWSEHIASGLLVVLIDLPYDIVSVKFVHWTWHDTDPNIADRHYWVPWNSYYFHATFAFVFSYFFHNVRKWIDRRNLKRWETGTVRAELTAVVAAALLAFPGGALLFIPLYHPFHDFYNVSGEVTAVTLLVAVFTIFWKFDRKSNRRLPERLDSTGRALMVHLVIHYVTFFAMVLFLNPEDVVAAGLHEPVGDCSAKIPVHTLLKTLEKRTFLCLSDYDEKYFDFHCLPRLPKEGSYWYTICGTPFENRAEYVLVLSLISFVAFMVFRTIHVDYDIRFDLYDLVPKHKSGKNQPETKKRN